MSDTLTVYIERGQEVVSSRKVSDVYCHLLLTSSNLMEVTTTRRILISFFCFIVISCGAQGLQSCDVEVTVRRGTAFTFSPDQHAKVKCPVQHCGKTVDVVWYKVLNASESRLNNSDHIQINENMLDGKMESVLTFKRISAEDSGLYKCRELNYGSIGHFINVSVSETNQRGPNHDENPDHPENTPKDQNVPSQDEMKMTALVYFICFLSIAVVLLIITVIVLLRIYVCKPKPRHQPKTHEEQPSHLIPGQPRRSPPVSRQASCISSSVIEAPPNNSEGGQVLTDPSADQSPKSRVYSKIDRTKSRKSVQHHVSVESTSEMKVISVVSSE